MSKIAIPDEAVEAMMQPLTYPEGTSLKTINAMRLRAALAAWPGMEEAAKSPYRDNVWLTGDCPTEALILPLPEDAEKECRHE